MSIRVLFLPVHLHNKMELLKLLKISLVGLLLCLWTPTLAADAYPALVVATHNSISKINLSDMRVFPLVEETKGSVGVDYNVATDVLYWSETGEPEIMFKPLTGSNRSCQVIMDRDRKSTPDGIALDWVHGNLYLTDAFLNTIEVINLETHLRKVLINDDLDKPRAIVVDPRDDRGSYMYWTDWGKVARIEKAGLDGSNRMQIVDQNILWPNGLAIDFTQNRVYWIDSKLNYVGSSDLEGRSPMILFRTAREHQIFAMDIFQDDIYYSEWNNNAVYKMNRGSNGSAPVLVRRDTLAPKGIRVVHSLRQPSATNRCDRIKCPASAMCLPSPSLSYQLGHTCVCADNPPASSTGTCVPGPGVRITTAATQNTQTTKMATARTTAVTPSSGASGRGLEWNVIGLLLFTMVAKLVSSY